MNNPVANIRRGTESPKSIVLPGSDGDESIALSTINELSDKNEKYRMRIFFEPCIICMGRSLLRLLSALICFQS